MKGELWGKVSMGAVIHKHLQQDDKIVIIMSSSSWCAFITIVTQMN